MTYIIKKSTAGIPAGLGKTAKKDYSFDDLKEIDQYVTIPLTGGAEEVITIRAAMQGFMKNSKNAGVRLESMLVMNDDDSHERPPRGQSNLARFIEIWRSK